MVEAKLFLELLMGLFADPACLYGAGEIPDRGICGQVREIIFALAAGAMLTDQPDLLPGHVLRARCTDALRRPVSDAHAHGGKARAQTPLRSPAPTDLSPFCVVEHGMGRARWDVRHMMLPRTSAACYWEDELHIGRINLLVPGDSDSPVQASCAERLTERGRQAVSGI